MGVNRERISSATMKEAYVQKMVKVFNDHDRWSLISLSNNSGKNLELKFVSALRRQFEFSVDSFQIILDRLLESYMQQDSQHKLYMVNGKDHAAEGENNSFSVHSQSTTSDSEKTTVLSNEHKAQISQTQPRDEVHEKESQTEAELSNQTRPCDVQKEETSAEPEEVSKCNINPNKTEPRSLSEMKQTSKEPEPPDQIELQHKLLDESEFTMTTEQLEQTQPCNGQQTKDLYHSEPSAQKKLTNHTEPPGKQRKLTGQMGHSDPFNASEITQCLNRAGEPHNAEQSDKSNSSKHFTEDQRGIEEDKSQHVFAPDSCANLETQLKDEGIKEKENSDEFEEEKENDREICEITEISAFEEKPVEDTQSIDCSCSTSSTLPLSNSQPTDTEDTPETHSTQHTDNSEKTASTLDAVSPPDSQENLPTPPSLVSNKKTSSAPCSKVSERLSHMVVLKHSSPKPPRRMCRKVTSHTHPSQVSENELLVAPYPDSHPCSINEPNQVLNLKPMSSILCPTSIPTSISEPDPSNKPSSAAALTSDPVPAPDIVSTSCPDHVTTIPQEPSTSQKTIGGSCETGPKETPNTGIVFNEQSRSCPRETLSELKESETLDQLVSHTDTSSSNIQEHAPTVDGAEVRTEEQTKKITPNPQESTSTSLPSPHSIIPPLLSFTPSPPSHSPPPCLTPPSPMLSTMSPTTSFSSPPQSFSPTSSCLSSPPYLTPPMLSLSPPPQCPSPPFPCLSPPLLCFTPPVESGDLLPQVASNMESLIVNADGDEQINGPSPQSGVPPLPLEDKMDNSYSSLMPQVDEPVSFPITIPSSTSHMLPHSPSEGSGNSASSTTSEVPKTVPDDTATPKVTADASELCNCPRGSDSVPDVEVLAESMYGDFEAAMDHLRYRLIATRNPEEIRGGGLLKYSNLLVRDYRPASETQIKTLERYMCSRFFIDFPDVQEQQRKILSYLKNHFIGEERSKYQYLMTLRRVIDDSTVCLMGHERRQTLNMITVLALKVLGEQNVIPNTDHVTCFYQPAPYMAEHSAPYLTEPSYCSYYIPQGGSTLLYQPYPLHLHPQTGLV